MAAIDRELQDYMALHRLKKDLQKFAQKNGAGFNSYLLENNNEYNYKVNVEVILVPKN